MWYVEKIIPKTLNPQQAQSAEYMSSEVASPVWTSGRDLLSGISASS